MIALPWQAWAVQADVIEPDELRGGEGRAGLFLAAWTMAQKAGYALGGLIGREALLTLGIMWGYTLDAAERARIRVALGR